MKFLKNYKIIPYILIPIIGFIALLIVSICLSLLPIIIVSAILLVILLPICISPFILTLVNLSNEGVKITYFKKIIAEVSWSDIDEVYFEKPLYHPNLCIKSNKYRDGIYPITFNINMKKLKYIIEKCSNDEISKKLVELSEKNNRRKYWIK